VRYFRQQVMAAGFGVRGGLFPVQTLDLDPQTGARTVHGQLRKLGVQSVLRRNPAGPGALLSFILTARHRPEEIDAAVRALVQAVNVPAQLQPGGG
jgi:8-amino-7-oxononanoate synthase